ncbi:hypothetical protein [Roseibium sp.]|uniref:hypothetical protein n=1 Tax=Roseibium sp. TaxID=1936156 RepID=UPI003B52FCAE
MRLITDKQAETAFDWLAENAGPAAAARAQRERAEYKVKQVKARLFLDADGTVAERDHKAVAHDDYDKAIDELIAATETDEHFRNQRNKCDAIISAWQTCRATERAFARVA